MQIKLTKYEVEKIRKEYFEGKKQTELAKEYGILFKYNICSDFPQRGLPGAVSERI